MIFNVEIKNRIPRLVSIDGGEKALCYNSGDTVKFTFDSEWDAHDKKTARFIWNGKYHDVEFTGDTCEVPVITSTAAVSIGVYVGELADGDPVLSTFETTIPYLMSIRCMSKGAQPTSGENYTNEAKGYATQAKEAAETAQKAAEGLYADGNTLNVGYDITNFGDAVSVGTIVGDIRVVDAPSEPLHFDFICDGVKYAGIEKTSEYNDMVGTVETLLYLKDDGSKETAYDFFAGYRYLSDLIQPVNMTAFLEIYNDNQECFNADIAQGIRIGDTIINENNALGLELIGSYSMLSFDTFGSQIISSFTGGGSYNLFLKTKFIGIDGVLFPFAIRTGTDYTQGYEKLTILVYGEGFPAVRYPVETDYSPHTFKLYR